MAGAVIMGAVDNAVVARESRAALSVCDEVTGVRGATGATLVLAVVDGVVIGTLLFGFGARGCVAHTIRGKPRGEPRAAVVSSGI